MKDCCSPVLVGNVDEINAIRVGYSLRCGEQSAVLYEADNLGCFPTVTVLTRISGAENPCTAFIVFVVEDGKKIEKEIGKSTEPSSIVNGPVFTVGNVRKIFVRCKGSGTDGCRGDLGLVLSYCGVNNCKNDDDDH